MSTERLTIAQGRVLKTLRSGGSVGQPANAYDVWITLRNADGHEIHRTNIHVLKTLESSGLVRSEITERGRKWYLIDQTQVKVI